MARNAARAEHNRSVASITKLFTIGPYDRNQITRDQIERIRDLVDLVGSPEAARRIGVCEVTLLRVCAGFGHRLRPPTAAVVRKWLARKAD